MNIFIKSNSVWTRGGLTAPTPPPKSLLYWSHYTTVCLIMGYLEVVVVCTLHKSVWSPNAIDKKTHARSDTGKDARHESCPPKLDVHKKLSASGKSGLKLYSVNSALQAYCHPQRIKCVSSQKAVLRHFRDATKVKLLFWQKLSAVKSS